MSDNIFPSLRGLTYPIKKSPNWSTVTQAAMSGPKRFIQLYSYPIYKLTLKFNYLRDKSLQTDDIHSLMGFFNSQGGAAGEFLFYDKTDHTFENQMFGTGDGSTKTFQLCRNYGGFVEPVFGLVSKPVILINGVTTDAFTWTTKGVITFNTAPGGGAVLRSSGTFYYRVHFLTDAAELSNICSGLWDLSELELESLKLL